MALGLPSLVRVSHTSRCFRRRNERVVLSSVLIHTNVLKCSMLILLLLSPRILLSCNPLTATRMGTPSNLYASGSPVAALGTGSGIKTTYKWGQMNLCGYDSSSFLRSSSTPSFATHRLTRSSFLDGRGACANAHFGQYFTPAATLLADSPSRIVRNQYVLPSSFHGTFHPSPSILDDSMLMYF